jgi:hypothetical protein
MQLAMHAMKGFAEDMAQCAGDVADAYRELGEKVLEARSQGRQGSVTRDEFSRYEHVCVCIYVCMIIENWGRRCWRPGARDAKGLSLGMSSQGISMYVCVCVYVCMIIEIGGEGARG